MNVNFLWKCNKKWGVMGWSGGLVKFKISGGGAGSGQGVSGWICIKN